MVIVEGFVIGVILLTVAVGGWVIAFIMWKRDPEAVKRAAVELKESAERFNQAAEKLETRVKEMENNFVLGVFDSKSAQERLEQLAILIAAKIEQNKAKQ